MKNMMQYASYEILSFLSTGKQFCQQISLIFICVYIHHPPFITRYPFVDKIISNTLRLLFQCRVWYCCVGQHRLIVAIDVGCSHGIPIIPSLYRSPHRYSQHCFIAMNSDPKEDDSTLVCFFHHQNTGALLIYTRKPVLDLLVVVSDTWSASTFTHMTKPMPLGSGMSFGVSSFPTTCPNSLPVQSLLSNLES